MCIKPYTHMYIMNSNFLHVKKACFSSLFVGLISILQSFSKFPQSHSHAPCPNLDLVFSEVLVWYIWSLGFLTSNSVGGIVSYNHSGSLTCSYYPESSHSAILFSVYQMPGLELEKKIRLWFYHIHFILSLLKPIFQSSGSLSCSYLFWIPPFILVEDASN